MEIVHRENIINNIDKLIVLTKYGELMFQCIHHGLINDVMKDNIEMVPDEPTRHRFLFEKITCRGPNAYDTLMNILSSSFPDALPILQDANLPLLPGQEDCLITNLELVRSCFPFLGSDTTRSQQSDDDGDYEPAEKLELTEFTGILPRVSITVQKSDKIHYSPAIGTYTMESTNRGVAFIANIINFKSVPERKGAKIDRDNFVTLLKQMGFLVYYYEDLTRAQLDQLTDQLSRSEELRKHECLIYCVLSHGRYDQGELNVELSDDRYLNIENIISTFNSKNCSALIGKPKIFIFPFCRGDKSHPGVTQKDVETDAKNFDTSQIQSDWHPPRTPTYSDIMILYGTLPGYVANRNPRTGSHYIEVLCNVWAEKAHDHELDHLMKIVGDKLRERGFENPPGSVQVCSTENRGFNRALYFNPGFVKPSRE